MPKYIVFNGELIDTEDFKISVEDRAFNYGDGLFETIVVREGSVQFWEDHIDRLMQGMDFLSLYSASLPHAKELKEQLQSLVHANALSSTRVKLQVWRKEGGLYFPNSNEVNYLLRCMPLAAKVDSKDTVGISPYILNSNFKLGNIKSLNSSIYILSSIFFKSKSWDDALLLNHEGCIAELTASNLFLVTQDKTVYTPNLASGCLNGIMRRRVIYALQSLQINIRQEHIALEDLVNFESCFASNVTGLCKINAINGLQFMNTFDLSQIEHEIYR